MLAANANGSTLISHSYYGPDRGGYSARDRDDKSCERSHYRSPATRGPGSVMFVNTVRVYYSGGRMAKKPLPVPILHEMHRSTLELGPGEEGRPPCPVIGMIVDSCAALNTMNF